MLQNLNIFIESSISSNINRGTNIPDYIRYMYENYLDTIKDFTTKNVEIQEIFKIFTETNRQTVECPDNSLIDNSFNDNNLIFFKYIKVFMRRLLNKPDIKFNSSEQEKLFAIFKLFKPNCVGFCGNFSNNWFTNQFINWDQELWNQQNAHTFINQANHFRDIIVIENAEGYNLTDLMLKYLKYEYDLLPRVQGYGGYTINLIKFINPTTLIDSESTKIIKPNEIVIEQPQGQPNPPALAQPNTEREIINSLNFYSINVDNIVGDNLNQKLETFWNNPASNKNFFKVTDKLYLRNVYDYNINVGGNKCNLSDIYSSYFDFINSYITPIYIYTNRTFKFYFRLARLTNDTGTDDDTEYRILLTIQINSTRPRPDGGPRIHRTHRISFILNKFGNKKSIKEYIDSNLQNDNNNNNKFPILDDQQERVSVTTYNGINIVNDTKDFYYFTINLINDLNLFIPYVNYAHIPDNEKANHLLEINYGIILTRIFDRQSDNNHRNYMKRLLYTFKLIGDQGQIRFAKLLKEHIQNNTDYRNKYSVLYTSNDFASHIYAGLLGQESYHINGYYFGDEVGSKFKFVDKIDTYRTKMLLYLSPSP